MSSPLPPIVVFGRDPGLLKTRRWVLEHAGFAVLTASDLADTERLILAERPDLLILCHSVPPEQCREAVALVHAALAPIKIIVMSAGTETCPVGEQDEAVSSFAGPRALVAVVERMVGSPHRTSGMASQPST